MKKILFTVCLIIISISGFSQCTPDPLYQDSTFGIWPDTTENLPCGLPSVLYTTVVNFKAPTDASDVDPAYPPNTPITWIRLDNITGLPTGFGYICNLPSCQWNGGDQGCATITGTTSTQGTYPLSIDVTAEVTVAGFPLEVPLSFGGYELIIDAACGGSSGPSVSISETSQIDCSGNCIGELTATATGGTAPYSYQWTSNAGGQTTATITGLCDGSYSVTVTDAGSNSTNQTFNLTEPAALSITTSSTNTCSGMSNGTASASGSGGVTPYNYEWTGGQTTSTATGLSTGSLTVTITDANGCTDMASVNISQATSMNTSITNTSPTCVGASDGSALITVTGSTPIAYLWSNFSTISNPTNLAAGTYYVTVTDINGCTAVDSTTIADGTGGPLTGPIIGQPTVSEFSTELYSVTQSVGSTYNWVITGGNQVSGGNTNSITIQWGSNGLGYITVLETDNNGCVGDTISLSVTIGSGVRILEKNKTDFSIFPNPSSNYVNIFFEAPFSGKMTITDLSGKIIKQQMLFNATSETQIMGLATGEYIINFVSSTSVFRSKLTVLEH